MSNNNMILVFPLGSRISLGELFEYLGELKIVSIIVSDNKGNEIKNNNITIIKFFIELILPQYR